MSGPLLADRVMETTQTTGTGALSLSGAVGGYRSFSAGVGNGNSCWYIAEAVDSNGVATGDWEVGTGTYTASGSSLSRDVILSSSSSGSAVSFSAGTKRVFVSLPAEAFSGFALSRGGGSIALNADGSITVSAATPGTAFSGSSTAFSGSGDGVVTITQTSASTFTTLIVNNSGGGQTRVEFGQSTDAGTRPSKGMVLFASAGGCGWADYEGRPLQFYTGTTPGTSAVAFRIDAGGGLHAIVGNAAGNKFLSCEYDQSGSSYGSFQIQAGAFVVMGGTANPVVRIVPYNGGAYSASLGLTVQADGGVTVGGYLDLGPAAWVRGDPGTARTASAPTNATNAMSALSDLTETLVAGRKYVGWCTLIAKNSTGAEGLQFDFNGGTATMTSFQAIFVATPIGATVGVATASAIGTALTCTAVATTDVVYSVYLSMVVNAGGTFIPRFSEASAHTSGTATVEVGSSLVLKDCPN